MLRYLIAYVSREGQTEKIAHHVARRFEDHGGVVRLLDIAAQESEAGVDDYDSTVIAGSVHRGHFDAELPAFIMRHSVQLRRCPSAFLPVSLSAASHDESERSAVDEIVQHFLAGLGWMPDIVLHVAGAIHDRRLGPLERAILHTIADTHGVERDPSGDTELTDWAGLDRFVRAFEELTRAGPCHGPVASGGA